MAGSWTENTFLVFMITNWVSRIAFRSSATNHSPSREKTSNGNSFHTRTLPFSSTRFQFKELSSSLSNIVTTRNVLKLTSFTDDWMWINDDFLYRKACNIMAEGIEPFYVLQNYGAHRNCTLTASFPAVISIEAIDVGGNKGNVNYDVSGRFHQELWVLCIFSCHFSFSSAINRIFWIR